jgi:hypothetical protein
MTSGVYIGFSCKTETCAAEAIGLYFQHALGLPPHSHLGKHNANDTEVGVFIELTLIMTWAETFTTEEY